MTDAQKTPAIMEDASSESSTTLSGLSSDIADRPEMGKQTTNKENYELRAENARLKLQQKKQEEELRQQRELLANLANKIDGQDKLKTQFQELKRSQKSMQKDILQNRAEAAEKDDSVAAEHVKAVAKKKTTTQPSGKATRNTAKSKEVCKSDVCNLSGPPFVPLTTLFAH